MLPQPSSSFRPQGHQHTALPDLSDAVRPHHTSGPPGMHTGRSQWARQISPPPQGSDTLLGATGHSLDGTIVNRTNESKVLNPRDGCSDECRHEDEDHLTPPFMLHQHLPAEVQDLTEIDGTGTP
ncbi:hypothetical protein CEP53_014185 [Fusarium sp. AF-6]|nr:hypothetical protein CEP53_014185 [Fusarium sp. AF-6]